MNKENVGALSVRNTIKNLPNCAQKGNRGITLVALIITIIVLLILAVVAIRAVQGDGIISKAKEAQTKYEKAQAEELSILSSYELEFSKNSPTSLSDEIIGTKFEKTTFVKDEKGKTFVVPAGYAIVKDDSTSDTVEVNKGVVITDEINQFVWVPVENINTMAKVTSGTDANGRTNYQSISSSYGEPDVITRDYLDGYMGMSGSDSFDAIESNLIEAGCTEDLNKDGKLDAYDFKIKLQEEYNSMVESVEKYGGFYIGRYETSLNGEIVQSVSGVSSATGNDGTWYYLYAKLKTYANDKNSVVSGMIYYSQYNAMTKWMKNSGIDVTSSTPTDTTGITASGNTTRVTGSESKDKLNNVYDLLGNSSEWTQATDFSHSLGLRLAVGGYYSYGAFSYDGSNSVAPDSSMLFAPSEIVSPRLQLYIK